MREWIVRAMFGAYSFLSPLAWIGVAIVLLILLPMSLFKRTRLAAANGLIIASYLFGATTWFSGAGVTFASFGWIGLFIGLVIFGFGVVPIGTLGAFFRMDSTELAFTLITMSVVAFATRMVGIYLAASAEATSRTS